MLRVALLCMLMYVGNLNAEQVTPFALVKEFEGDHIANLAAHPLVNIEKLGSFGSTKTPVWVRHTKDENFPSFYDDVLWEIEPFGEYLYFLAGDFSKNEKGLLRYRSAKTIAKVELVFEKDAIDVYKIDDVNEQSLANKNEFDLGTIKGLTIGEIDKRAQPSAHGFDTRILVSSIPKIPAARLILYKGVKFDKRLKVKLVMNDFREAQNEGEYDRLQTISYESSDPKLKINDLVKDFSELTSIYSDMPYLHVSGATRY